MVTHFVEEFKKKNKVDISHNPKEVQNCVWEGKNNMAHAWIILVINI